ncbi:MAG: ATP-binding protein [Aestuariivita sp.]|nr:ATP-binding protein [Aestuariivita sp.]MCY4203223.1 ATP-binding protein [Aestuariivita sp.]
MTDIAGLHAFSETPERDVARFFAGREAFLDHIKKACEGAAHTIAEGGKITSATRLFYGAPGAGKTSLLTEFHVHAARGNFGTPAPVIVDLPSSQSLRREEDVILQIAEALGKDSLFRTTTHSDARVNADIPVIGGGVTKGQVQNPPAATFFHLKQITKTLSPRRPILLCVDEIQNMNPEAKDIMDILQQGKHGLPIIPIYAGLGNSLNVIMRHGVSRPVSGYIHGVEALASTEAEAAVTAMLDRFKVDQSGADRDWPATLAQRADCWPQHLHNAMRALALELIRRDVKGVLARVNPEAVFTHERRLRMQAYGWRMSEMISDHRELAARVMQRVVASTPTRSEVKQIIAVLHKTRSCILTEGVSVNSFFNELLHQGLLQEFHEERADGTIVDVLRCPIPSLATFVMERGGVDSSLLLPEPAAEPPLKAAPEEEGGDPYACPEPKPPSYEDADPSKIS